LSEKDIEERTIAVARDLRLLLTTHEKYEAQRAIDFAESEQAEVERRRRAKEREEDLATAKAMRAVSEERLAEELAASKAELEAARKSLADTMGKPRPQSPPSEG
jgi:hypothetical protein